jgi:hypothetical protein
MDVDSAAGLCASCVYVHVIETRQGSRFYRCRRAETDPRYRRYPHLPVLACPGYESGVPPAPARVPEG